MKNLCRLIILLGILLAAFSACVIARAEIPENNGLGTLLAGGAEGLVSAAKNVSAVDNPTGNNRNWLDVQTVDLTDGLFQTAVRITCGGTNAAPGTNQVRMLFNAPAMAAGDYVYVSFYYRVRSACEGLTYEAMPPSFACTSLHTSSGNRQTMAGTTYQSAEAFDTWYKVEYLYPLSAAVPAGTPYLQMSFARPAEGLQPYVVEVADVHILYFGAVTGASDGLIQSELTAALSNAAFSYVQIDGAAVDLETYPTAYRMRFLWDGTLPAVTAADLYGRAAAVEYETAGVPQTVRATVYALRYDKTNPDDPNKRTYELHLDYVRAAAGVTVDGADTAALSGCTGGEAVQVHVTAYNPNGEAAEYVAVLGIYDGKKCVAAIPWKLSVSAAEPQKTADFSYILPEGSYEGFVCRAFVIEPRQMIKVNEAL